MTPAAAGRSHIVQPAEAPPYPGAKPCFLVAAEWLSALLRLIAAELPAPVRKPASKRRPS